ncbi:MAG TPA: NADP-dependent oxidoreductase [Vicinamibacterales bacterium]|nr:NADP-dependent oxidoreductase [Vicinamibacterales bacterium]
MTNRQIRLQRRPTGAPTRDDFSIVDAAMPGVKDGHVLRRTIYLSLDPYMRGRMSDARSYATPVALGDVMVGGTVSRVIESRDPKFAAGDFVTGMDGWQQYVSSPSAGLRKLDPNLAPISTAVGLLGMPGLTAYVGLLDIGQAKSGETVVVSAASGAVGSVVGQIARLKGCRAVGIAGTAEKCEYLTRELGFHAAVNHRDPDLRSALRAACPDGIDVYFENVGGVVLDAVMGLINRGARIPLCGLISQYNASPLPPGPNLAPLLTNRARIQGFIILDHFDRFGAFLQECAPWVRNGQLRYREDIVNGLDAAPDAFIGMLEGKNFGKLLVRVSPDPTQPS